MDEAYIGAIVLFGGNFAPRNWAFCDGSLLPINQNTALYSILGTTYGGNGSTTFALPDLRSRVPVHANNGQAGPGQPAVQLGQSAGSASVSLLTANLPAHNHTPMVSSANGTSNNPAGNVPAVIVAATSNEDPVTVSAYGGATNLVPGNPAASGITGSGQPVNVMPPYLGLNYIICLQGLYPTRN